MTDTPLFDLLYGDAMQDAPNAQRASGSLQQDGSAQADRARRTGEAFAAMEQEQWEEYQEYVKLCGGIPISKIKASRPPAQNIGIGGSDTTEQKDRK